MLVKAIQLCRLVCAAAALLPVAAGASPPPVESISRGQRYEAQADYGRAVACIEAVVQKCPENVYARNYLGLLLAKSGRYEQALRQFALALRQEPANWFAREWAARIRKRLEAATGGAAGGRSASSIDSIISHASRVHSLDEALLRSVIKAESNFKVHSLSQKGAMGLMQLMPATARDLGVTDPWNPRQNIMGGAGYLKMLLDRYDGDVVSALAAYNWGMHNVDRSDGSMPEETRTYLRRVARYYRGYKGDAAELQQE